MKNDSSSIHKPGRRREYPSDNPLTGKPVQWDSRRGDLILIGEDLYRVTSAALPDGVTVEAVEDAEEPERRFTYDELSKLRATYP